MGNYGNRILALLLVLVLGTQGFWLNATRTDIVFAGTEVNENKGELLGEQFIQLEVPVSNSDDQVIPLDRQVRDSINITLHVWWSENEVPNGLGRNCPDYGILGQRYWLNYEIYETGHWNFETLTGNLLDSEHDYNYSVTESIYYPNGSRQMSYSYNNDNNWISLLPNTNIYTGKYKGVVSVSGDLSFSSEVYLDVRSIITYNANGGNDAPSDQVKSHGNTLILSSNVPARNGYTFNEWTASTGGTYIPGDSFNVNNSNVTMMANWTAAESLTLSSSKTTYINFKNKAVWYTYTPDVTGDYTFTSSAAGNLDPDMYVYNSSFTEIGSSSNGGNINNTFNLRSGTQYYFKVYLSDSAHSTGSFGVILNKIVNQHTVIYDYAANGGASATKQSDIVFEGNEIDLTPSAIKPGWKFIGWNTDKDAAGKLDSLVMGKDDVTLYAIFEQDTITVSYDANGGNGTPANQSKTLNEDLLLSTEKPKRSGYYFLGWSVSETATVADYLAGDVFTEDEDTTLYAVWETAADHYDTVLVLDVSGSMSSEIRLLKNAATQFCELVLTDNPNNRISIVVFSSNVRKLNFSSDMVQLADYINLLSANGGTNMGPAVTEAREILKMGAASNIAKNIIFMADGEPDNSREVTSEYELLGNTINTFSLGFHVSGSTQTLMKSLQNTGYWDVSDGTDLAAIFEKINNNIRSDILNKDVMAEDGTLIVLEESVYKCDVGETIYVGGTFSSSSISCNSNTVTWETNDPSAVVFGFMSVIGTSDNAIFSIPVTGNKAGVYTVTITANNGASSRRKIEIGTVNKNLELNTVNHFLEYSNNGFERQQFDLDISVHNKAGLLITSNFTEEQLKKFTSGKIDVLVELPEGLSFNQTKEVREMHFLADGIKPNEFFDINETVYLYNMALQEATKQIDVTLNEYDEENKKNVILTGKCDIKISQNPYYQIDAFPLKCNELPQELSRDLSYDGDLKIGAGIHLVVNKSLTVNGRIIVEGGGSLDIDNKGKLYAEALEIKKEGNVTCNANSANIGNIIVRGGTLYVMSGLLTSDYLNAKSGYLKIQGGTVTANNLTVENSGVLCQFGGKIRVSGDFRTSTSGTNLISGGELWIGGNFTQTKNNDAFQASDDHSSIFFGNSTHTIKMQKRLFSGKTDSYFNNLYIEGDFSLDGPEKIDSVAQKEIYKVTTDVKNYTFKKGKNLSGQREFEKALVKALDTEVAISLVPVFGDKVDGQTAKAIEGCLAAWLTEISSPFITMIIEDGFTTVKTYTHTLELTLKDKTKIYFTAVVTNHGSYATFGHVNWNSPDLGVVSDQLLGLITESSISAFKTQAARFLAEECLTELVETLGIKGFKMLTAKLQYGYAIEKFLDLYLEVKDCKDEILNIKAVMEGTIIYQSQSMSVMSNEKNIKNDSSDRDNFIPTIWEMSMPSDADEVSFYNLRQSAVSRIMGEVSFRDSYLESSVRTALNLDAHTPITAEMAQTVKRLDLRKKMITDIEGLQAFYNLEVLYLSDNYISDLSPLSGLTNLKTLDLRNNNISSVSGITSLIKMQYLDISENLINTLPMAFASLSDMLYLDLSENNINSLTAIQDMAKMQYLNLSGNALSSRNLNDLQNLTELLELYVANCSLNQINGINPNAIQVLDISGNSISSLPTLGYSELQILNASENRITNLSPLKSAVRLKELYVADNLITNTGFSDNFTFSSVVALDIQDNQITTVSFLAYMPKIQSLFLGGNLLVDISALGKAATLRKLYMPECGLNDADMDAIKALIGLEELDVSFNELTSLLFAMSLNKLKVLDICGNEIVAEEEALRALNNHGTEIITSDTTVNVQSVEFLDESFNMEIGEKVTPRYYIYPYAAVNKNVNWRSSNQDIASVDAKGVVTANARGTAIITVTTEDGSYSSSCTINVDLDFSETTYTVTVKGGKGSGSFAVGEVVTIAANAATNAEFFKQWKFDFPVNFVDDTSAASVTTKFVMPAQNITVTAVYENVQLEKGSTFIVKNLKYKIIKPAKSKSERGTVQVTGFSKNSLKKSMKTIAIPATVKSNKITYNVVGIRRGAFSRCKMLKKVTIGSNIIKIGSKAFFNDKRLKSIAIKSKKLKSVGKNAFMNIHKHAKMKVPSSKFKKYKNSILKGKGQKETVKIIK